MENANQRLEVGMQVGDYRLDELIYDGPTTRTWQAHQVSVDREVIIDSLNRSEQDNEETVATFLSDVRAKAHVDHPLIGSVFEAVRKGKLCFYARECLHGQTLQQLSEDETKMRPEKVVHIIRQIAEANLYLEQHKIASLPISPEQIFISEHSLCRLINMAVGGDRDHNISTQDKHTIATAFIPILQEGCPGSTRTRSLLNYMEDLGREIPLTWEQIRELSEEVELQLSEPSVPIAISEQIPSPNKSKSLILLAGAGIGAAIVIGLGAVLLNQPEKPKERQLTDTVHIPAGKYLTHEGSRNELNEFWIDAHEVTIAEYAKFLEAMDLFSAEESEIYQHPEQPSSKTNHLPLDWQSLLTAARNGASWNGIQVDLNCPIIGIDWWDAFAYCAYNRRRLPTQEEWNATLRHSKADHLTRSNWGPVDQQSKDITNNGIYGLAGNVSEWAANPSKDPTFPTKPEMPVVCGGSYLKKSSSATSREWLSTEQTEEIDARSIRRGDIGFRTISNRPD
ncbi:SUMF1/EgtB/PvdO family nonheme iron enzyme [Rubritalea spongiae]|uniref:SUMF1/EgtB/PvdO family nonheme iron enzyme n=1 Tax=Rubritalea spongiae TaxID=430797 RepID=A0ABW5E0T3_9BACT